MLVPNSTLDLADVRDEWGIIKQIAVTCWGTPCRGEAQSTNILEQEEERASNEGPRIMTMLNFI